ncbi:MAG: polysaccharide deacetylase family protein [Bacteroidetes bacterium]|nr:polysaccharide deacetylase family protein [Bacteroidota bacterium]
MRARVNIITLIVITLISFGWYFSLVSIRYIVPVILIYIVINIVGASKIQLNYFFVSHCKGITENREIALTFDDGPHPEITPSILKLLEDYNVTATFFCTGKNATQHPHILTEIINKGHIIGNHSYGHSKLFDLFSPSKMHGEITDTNTALTKITKKSPLLFRPPYGVTNPMLGRALKKTNMISVGWSLRSFDTVKNNHEVLKKLKSNTKPGDIVLFHDTVPNTINIVKDYLIWLQESDYKVVSLTSLLKIPAYEE